MKHSLEILTLAEQRKSIAEIYYGLDLSKAYFELLPIELASVIRFMHVCNFRRKDTKGWSQAQYFWQYLKKVHDEQIEITKKYGLPF